MTHQPGLAPVTAEERIEAMDVIRGFALLGILLMNIEGMVGPLNGALTYSNKATADVLSQNGKVQLPPHRFYPCGEAVDLLIDFIKAHLGEWAALIGREDVDWVGFTTRPFLYPRGTALSWHADAVAWCDW